VCPLSSRQSKKTKIILGNRQAINQKVKGAHERPSLFGTTILGLQYLAVEALRYLFPL
jgi:hypothetical protein